MKDILIIGAGEIGTSLKQVEEEAGNKVYMRDLEPSSWERNDIDSYDVCHVAIPFKDKDSFIEAVRKHLLTFKTKVTIIHSTVEVGTTRELIKQSGDEMIVHSFVRGVHPNLAEGIKTFDKSIGAINEGVVNELCDEYNLDYHRVYTWPNATYNMGYKELGMDNVIRPVLTPPDGRISGHCIVPNFHLLPDCNLKKFCIEEEQNVRC